MNDNELKKLDDTLRKCNVNRKTIIRRKEEYIIKRTKIMIKEVLDEYLELIRDFGSNKELFKVDKIIRIDDINDSDSLMNIFSQYIDIELLKDYCEYLGIIINFRTIDSELIISFILDKELYENGIYDFNDSDTYIDNLNLKLKKEHLK